MKKFGSWLLLLALFGLLAACSSGAEPTAVPQTDTTGDNGAPVVAPVVQDDLLAEIQERGTIRISTDPNYAPQSFLKPDGTYEGFDIDVANEIAERMGVEVEFVTPGWDLITAGNWGGQWDISVGSMTVTTGRQEVLHFASPPYYYTPAQFAVATDSDIQTIDDIAGEGGAETPVCVGTATTYEHWINGAMADLGLPIESVYMHHPDYVDALPLATDAECIQAIQAGREEFEVLLTSNTVIEAGIAAGAPIRKVGDPVFSENLAVAVDRQSAKDPNRLVAEISRIIAEMHADGTLSALSTQWFGGDLTQNPVQ